MKVYTMEPPQGFFEEYDLRSAKKTALRLAKEANQDVLVTCTHKPSYRMDWFTMTIQGQWIVNSLHVNKNEG